MQSMPKPLFPIESSPYGLTYSEWTARWWQWLLSIPRLKSPAFDQCGENANINQYDPNVFFLCQTIDGVKLMMSRNVVMKPRKSILMPIINWISILHDDGETDEELIAIAKKRMDLVSTLEIKIDGLTIKEGLEGYRARSPFFDVMLSEDNIFDLSSGSRRCVADGYWIFIKPLEKDIRLSSFGSCSSGVNKFGVNYNITVI